MELIKVFKTSSFYMNNAESFLDDSAEKILGRLSDGQAKLGFEVKPKQMKAWKTEIDVLKTSLSGIKITEGIKTWSILLEYPIPRRASRIDAVIIAQDIIFVLEFKAGSEEYEPHNRRQVEDYALDLRDFHRESANRRIIPILVSTSAPDYVNELRNGESTVHDTLLANERSLKKLISDAFHMFATPTSIDIKKWDASEYFPTPTIIEAAMHLYKTHEVSDISRNDAGHKNLTKTSDAVVKAIEYAKSNNKKVICFVTGVPGSGKTLAGLNMVHNTAMHRDENLGVFLSGNGPLVKVLQAALASDANLRKNLPIKKAGRETRTLIQNVHLFLGAYYENTNVPIEHIVVFDEAQRAWNLEQSEQKFGRDIAEPELLLKIMDRRKDWAAIIALVGVGQEINTGEGGLREWGTALSKRFPQWDVYISPQLNTSRELSAGDTLFVDRPKNNIIEDPNLHLGVSVRSYRAEMLADWATELLNNHSEEARRILKEGLKNYPIVLTRDLVTAKSWLRKHARGLRRAGLVASSEARRLRPHGIFVDMEVKPSNWFLGDEEDIRSSSFLELVGKEYLVQGLELDWAGICWDADFRRENGCWAFYKFRGSKWQNVNLDAQKIYQLNKYRVLLTRAREGMVIWVPRGDANDRTRSPDFYNPIANFLKDCGVEEI